MNEAFLMHSPDTIMFYLQPVLQGTVENEHATQVAELTKLAYLAKKRGDFESALEYESKAYELCLELRDVLGETNFHPLTAGRLYNMGQLCHRLGRLDKAKSYFKQAKALDATAGNLVGQAMSIRSLGFLQQDSGDLSGALELHKEALELDSETGFEGGIAMDKANIGAIYFELGDFQLALQYLEQALRSFESGGQFGEAGKAKQLIQTVKSKLA